MHENAPLRVLSDACDFADTQGVSKEECDFLLLPVAFACPDGVYGNEQAFLPKIFCLRYGISWEIWKGMAWVSLFWRDVCANVAFSCQEYQFPVCIKKNAANL